MFEAYGLWKEYSRNVVALKNVTLRIVRKGINVLLGPNGSGKTTLLKLWLGFLRPTKGYVRVFDRDPWREWHFIRRTVSSYLEDYGVVPWRKGIEIARAFSKASDTSWQRIREYASMFGVDEYWHRVVASYSTGMLKRLKLVLALSRECDAYVLDEPYSGLDKHSIDLLNEVLTKISQNAIIVIATHQVEKLVPESLVSVAVLVNGELKMFVERGSSTLYTYECPRDYVFHDLLPKIERLELKNLRVVGNRILVSVSKPLNVNLCRAVLDPEEIYREALQR